MASPCLGAEVRVSLTEKLKGETTAYVFDIGDGRVRRLDQASGSLLPATTAYRVEGRRLCGNECFFEADEILFQGHQGDVDVVVYRKEYNSFSNPLRWLAALSGHPVQVSSIRIAAIGADGHRQAELTRKPSSYDWKAQVVE
jgi:hypothetical protein